MLASPHPSTSSEVLELDPKLQEEAIKDFKEKYEAELVTFRLFSEKKIAVTRN